MDDITLSRPAWLLTRLSPNGAVDAEARRGSKNARLVWPTRS